MITYTLTNYDGGSFFMKQHIPLPKKSQYDIDIKKRYRSSACGPVTAYTILNYYFPNRFQRIDQLYKQLGSTPIGLFTWHFIRNLSKLLGKHWIVEKCSVEEMKQQIDQGNPVAAKFDKWFTWNWRGHYSYDYHWVSVVGYEEADKGLFLFVHDHGGKNRPSQLQTIPYELNAAILTFVKIEKTKE